ncbi:hypothetical protein D0Z03_001097 [Geotrichum reessii]|nr:hypothetical protein D0Z03_001097 [Galactomyces reessii]
MATKVDGFPAKSVKSITSDVNGIKYDVVTTGFSDRISVMVHSNGLVSRIAYVPLLAAPTPAPVFSDPAAAYNGHGSDYDDDGNYIGQENNEVNDDFLPLPYLTPMVAMGHGDPFVSTYAAQIASLIARQAPDDRRIVMIGLGPHVGPKPNEDLEPVHRKQFLEIIKLIEQSRVW